MSFVQISEEIKKRKDFLNKKTLDLVLQLVDLLLDLRAVVGGDAGSNNRARDTAGTAQGDLGRNEDVRNVLVLTEKGQVEHNLNGLGVSSHDNELRDTTVEGLSGLIGTLLGLAKVGSLLDNVEDLLGGGGVSQRESTGVRGTHIFLILLFCKV